ncbi:hypothetical protein Nepgr_003872 [Nepenthes gracilis]|uniref:Uncharacterized protein n=1 Tax=Nepenthes gracilis TaxID=150966 RepID=A0AAD3S0B6_NEPGR|nr:hypothetical protein Nepgr_003872 [Nepenthes gracilis]
MARRPWRRTPLLSFLVLLLNLNRPLSPLFPPPVLSHFLLSSPSAAPFLTASGPPPTSGFSEPGILGAYSAPALDFASRGSPPSLLSSDSAPKSLGLSPLQIPHLEKSANFRLPSFQEVPCPPELASPLPVSNAIAGPPLAGGSPLAATVPDCEDAKLVLKTRSSWLDIV